jgi:hypothetical protein
MRDLGRVARVNHYLHRYLLPNFFNMRDFQQMNKFGLEFKHYPFHLGSAEKRSYNFFKSTLTHFFLSFVRCPSLLRLQCSDCSEQLDSDTATHIFESFPSLIELDLSNCENITSFEQLSCNLEILKVSNNPYFDTNCFRQVHRFFFVISRLFKIAKS